jgi:hypothetical protein
MRNLAKLAAVAALAATASLAATAGAKNSTLWVHGRNDGVPPGFSYWVNDKGTNIAQTTGVNPVAVDYDGTAHIAASNPVVVAALNANCNSAAGQSCYIAAHSAGAAQIGYAEWLYPDGAGQASPNQNVRWSILWVATGGSAAGGSELAGNTAYFFTGYNMDLDLVVSTMRGMYTHDNLGDDIAGHVFNFLGGDYASLTTCLFPGGCVGGSGSNDSAVAFHSSGHFRSVVTTESDSANGTKGGNWWDYSYASFVDSSDGSYGHCIDGSYPCEEGKTSGIMGKVQSYVSANAK